MDRKQNTLCKIHTLKAIHIGSCITCPSQSPICETKGCIKHHTQSEKMHNSYTIKDIQKIIDGYVNQNDEKRSILKKMINQYFNLLKAEVENKYHEISYTVQNLRFQNFILDASERKLADTLISKRYSQLSCSDIARIVPKMIKAGNFQEKQFGHLKDFINSQKENIEKTVNSLILNLPYFRQDQSIVTVQKFTQLSDELLANVNKKIQGLTFKPKKLKIKYSKQCLIQAKMTHFQYYLGLITIKYDLLHDLEEKFIKLMQLNENLKEVQILELYCVQQLDYKQMEHQLRRFSDGIPRCCLKFAFHFGPNHLYRVQSDLHAVSIQRNLRFIDEMIENKNIEFKIYKKEWHF